jgi:hypothetical protein
MYRSETERKRLRVTTMKRKEVDKERKKIGQRRGDGGARIEWGTRLKRKDERVVAAVAL